MPARRSFRGDAWHLAKGYWRSDERLSAWLLLTAIILLHLGLVYANVLLNEAHGALFNSLERRDGTAFYAASGTIVLLVALYLAAALLRSYLEQTLQLRWRRWLTDEYLTGWLRDRTFYRMRFTGRVDNPDQRISEDIRLFAERSIALALGLLSSASQFVAFAAILWGLSGALTLEIGVTLSIPGYMLWAAVVYAGAGSIVAHIVGHPLIRLNNRQLKVEADFRFSLLRLREEAEGIALYGGEAQERRFALHRFRALYENFRQLIRRNVQYLLFQLFVSQFAYFFALLVTSPRYFSGAIHLGTMMQSVNAFERVNESLSWFIGSYPLFAEWRATADRLRELRREFAATSEHDGLETEAAGADAIELKNVRVSLPDGTPLLGPLTTRLNAHEAVLFDGNTGTGKSTLLRVLAGLWPFAKGHLRIPRHAKLLFLPQHPYMPVGTLREALWFPDQPNRGNDGQVRRALGLVGLRSLASRLDEEAHWSQVLSLGELQRVAIARALLLKPDWLFLDEATSAMDEREQSALYRILLAELPQVTIASVGHRQSLEQFHARVIGMSEMGARSERRRHDPRPASPARPETEAAGR